LQLRFGVFRSVVNCCDIICNARWFRKHLKLISYNLVRKNTSFFSWFILHCNGISIKISAESPIYRKVPSYQQLILYISHVHSIINGHPYCIATTIIINHNILQIPRFISNI
jgi:hypothetical protein